MAKKPPLINDILVFRNSFSPPLAIIPLLVREKTPAVSWKRVFNGSPFTDDELTEMWRTRFNPGIATGRASMVIVVDADNEAAIAWVEEHLPPTPVVTVTRHGRHYYYRFPVDFDGKIPNSIDALGEKARWAHRAREEFGLDVNVNVTRDQTADELAAEHRRAENARELARDKVPMGPVIDIRGDGGQVVAPGGIHPSGFVYQMTQPWTPELFDAMPVFDTAWFEGRKWRATRGPRVLSDLAAKRAEVELEQARTTVTPETRIRRARLWLDHVEGAVSGAGGQNKLYYAACRLVQGFLIEPDTAYEMLKTEYNPRCQPPWSDEELAHKVEDAAKNMGANAGFMLIDRPDRPKIRENAVYEADLSDFDIDLPWGTDTAAGEPGAAAGASSGQEEPGLPPDDEDEFWVRRWARPFGVDYMQVKADRAMFSRKKNDGVWTLPPHTNNLAVVLKYSRFLNLDLKFNVLKLVMENHGHRIEDRHVTTFKKHLDHMWQSDIADVRVEKAVQQVAEDRAYEPAQDWLLSLPAWDGVSRIESVPERIMCAGDEPVLGTMFRHFMTGLVGRIMKPGVKVDTILFLVSPGQGAFKSKFFKYLIDGSLEPEGWFTDNPFSLRDKDGKMLIGTNILVEWGEGEHAKSAKMIDTVKAFLSTQEDEFRAPYTRHVIKRPRRCVFCGTSNDEELLHDITGSRRFYIIQVGPSIDTDALVAEREQLFAEALDIWNRHQVAEYKSPEWHATRWWFTAEEDLVRQRSVERFQSRSAWFDDIARWLETRARAPQPMFTVDDVISDCLQVTRDKKTKKMAVEVRNTLVQLRCAFVGRRRVGDVRGRWWRPPTPEDDD